MAADLLRRFVFWSGLPLAAPQGLWLRRRAMRLPAAAGADHGIVGVGDRLDVLALGDSIIAGVGADVSECALPARFAGELAERLGRRVHWRAVGLIGAGAADVSRRLVPQIGTANVDLVLLSVGINDVMSLRTRAQFRRDLLGLLEALRGHSPRCRIVIAGMPPLHGFPLLPQPLRFLFGQRARSFELLMRAVAENRPSVLHVPSTLRPALHHFAADGYHPNAACHFRWASELAQATRQRWTHWRGGPARG